MVTKKYLTVALILVAAGAALLLLSVDWEARAVKKQLRSLAKEMTWAPGENELEIVSRTRHMQEKMAQTCQVDIPGYNISRPVLKEDVPASANLNIEHEREGVKKK